MSSYLYRFFTSGFVFFCAPALILAQGLKAATLSDLAAYTGADREQIFLAGAKAEGKVV